MFLGWRTRSPDIGSRDGKGQGLAIARSIIVDKHAGSIDFESVIGEGTAFVIRLPHHDQALPAA
jgi:signal transduction histidine kinase